MSEQRLVEIEARYQRSVAGDPYPFADIGYLLDLARARQQAEQARDAHSAQCGKCGTWTCGYCGVSDPDGKWHCEKCWGFGPLAEATKRVAALTQALKDVEWVMVYDGSGGMVRDANGGMYKTCPCCWADFDERGGQHVVGCGLDAALTGAQA